MFRLTPKEERDFRRIIAPFNSHPKVQEMKNYIQHGRITTYEHCMNVARKVFYFNRRLHLRAREKEMVAAGFLHDFYLNDWHNKDGGSHDWHGFIHADRAANNAKRIFHIGKVEQEIIRCHMWPLNITRTPRCRESLIVTLTDKLVSLDETLFKRDKKGKKGKNQKKCKKAS